MAPRPRGHFLVCQTAQFPRTLLAQWQRSRFAVGRLGNRVSIETHKRFLAILRALSTGWLKTCWASGARKGRISGGVGEWLKPPDCKSGLRKEFVGSNPTPSTIWLNNS